MRREQTNKQGGRGSATVGKHSRERQQEPPPVGDIARTETRAEVRQTARKTTRPEARTETRTEARTEARAATGWTMVDIVAGVCPFGGWRLSVPPFEPLRVGCPPLSFSPYTPLLLYIIIIYIL